MKTPIFVSALLGWASAVGLFIAGESLTGHLLRDTKWWLPFLYVVIWSGVIAFPSCLIAGALVHKYLPPASPWWQPRYAALCGGISGIVVMQLIFSLISRDFEFNSGRWLGSITAAVPGAVCGFSLARFKAKVPKL